MAWTWSRSLIFVWIVYLHDNSYLALFNYHYPVSIVVCLPYCLISGT